MAQFVFRRDSPDAAAACARPPRDTRVTFCFAIFALLLACAAVFSSGIYHADEYFQIVEFASYKLGITSAANLPWEFAARIRPWTQPGLFYLLASGGRAAGVDDPFTLMLLFRLGHALLGGLAMWLLVRNMAPLFPAASDYRRAVRLLLFCCVVPYMLVRPSSEGLATTMFIVAFALLLPYLDKPAGASWSRLFAVGALLGLSFNCRFQMAIAMAGLWAWMLLRQREKLGRLLVCAAGSIVVAALGLLVDMWGYGRFTWTPWNYVYFNLVMGKASSFGTSPFYAYFLDIPAMVPPIGLLLLLSLLVLWRRLPGHVLTWVTLPFFAVHCVISHKEARFLFPLAVFALMGLALLLPPADAPATRWWQRPWLRRTLVGFNAAYLAVLCLAPVRIDLGAQQYVYRHTRPGVKWVGWKYHPYQLRGIPVPVTFLVPAAFEFETCDRTGGLDTMAGTAERPVYLMVKLPLDSALRDYLVRQQARFTLVHTSYPYWLEPLNINHWIDRLEAVRIYRVN
jgi:GPI mannosyltransferase 3